MVVPITQQARQQIGPTQEGTVGGRGAAQHEVVATARARVPAVQHEFFGGKPRLMGSFVEKLGMIHEFLPVVGRVDIDLDDARVRGNLQGLEAGIARGRIAFQHDLHALLGGRRLDSRDQLQIVLQMLEGRHEHEQDRAPAPVLHLGLGAISALGIPHLDAERGADDPTRGLLRGREGVRRLRTPGRRLVRTGAAMPIHGALAGTQSGSGIAGDLLSLQGYGAALGKAVTQMVGVITSLSSEGRGTGQGGKGREGVLRY